MLNNQERQILATCNELIDNPMLYTDELKTNLKAAIQSSLEAQDDLKKHLRKETRNFFAAHALQGLLVNNKLEQAIIETSFKAADLMIEESDKIVIGD